MYRADDLADCANAAHAAALGTGRWEALLERTARIFPGTKVSLVSEQPSPLRNIGLVTHGYEADVVRDYVDHYSKINPWTPHWKAIPLHTAVASDDVLPSYQFRDSEFYEFIRRAGDAESAAGIKLFESSNSFATIAVHYGRRQAADYNIAVPAFLTALAPHLENAVQLSARFAALSEPAPTLESAVQQFQSPAFLIGPVGELIDTNAAGRDLIAEGRAVRLENGERLWLMEDVTRSQLGAMLTADGGRTVTDLKKPILGTEWRLFGFTSGELDRRMAWMPKSKTWVLAVYEPTSARPSIQLRAKQFGLTPQETRVTAAIVEGRRVDAVAQDLGISSATVRQHLKSIFAKTNTHRQAELIARLNSVEG